MTEIFDEFYTERHALYVKRRDYQLQNLFNDLTLLKSKIRFMNHVMDDTIVIFKRKKQDIIKELQTKEFIQVHAGKVVDASQGSESTNYDYLIKMSLYLFTEDEIEKLEAQIMALQNSHDELFKLSVEEIWLSECDLLLKRCK